VKGQGRDPAIFVANYIENDWKYKLGYNGAPVGNSTCDIEESKCATTFTGLWTEPTGLSHRLAKC